MSLFSECGGYAGLIRLRPLAIASNPMVRTSLNLGYRCGLRATEAVRLKVKHINSA
jgi:hypothetical protein